MNHPGFVTEALMTDYTSKLVHVQVGETLICKKVSPLLGKCFAPPLTIDQETTLLRIYLDTEGNAHLDMGIISEIHEVTSFETREILPESGKGGTHWCHPSRFILK